jgi:phospholipid/cholesterol/gamma-HCH transport system substrate-binding protein
MSGSTTRRLAAVAVLAASAVAVAALVASAGGNYSVRAVFANVGGLVKGFTVRIDGAPVGKVSDLELDSHDHVIATLDIDKRAAPIGRDATATVRAADLLGEKFVDLVPGNRSDPAPSGSVIPLARTGLAVELDDVLNALDLPTREGLRAFVNEQGTAFAGRGQDLAALLATLPPSLDRTQELLAQLGQNNAVLGRLVDESDRVVAAVSQQRAPLRRLVGSAATTLQTLAGRRAELAATVTRAPATLISLRRALVGLEDAAIPLGPAAQGLANTAPQLTATLDQLPQFTASARPTLAIVQAVAPTLRTLGREGTPVVRRLGPLTSELATFAAALDPVSSTLDDGAANLLGFMEGWARATQARDAGGHVFRFGLTVSPETLSSLAPLFVRRGQARAVAPARGERPAAHPAPAPLPAPSVPSPATTAPAAAKHPGGTVLTGIQQALGGTVTQTLQNLGLGGDLVSRTQTTLKSLLGYLLK